MSPLKRADHALDLFDSNGKPDHGKVMGFLFFLSVLLFKALGISFTPIELTILSINIYGGRMVIAALKSGVFNALLGKSGPGQVVSAVQEGRGGSAE